MNWVFTDGCCFNNGNRNAKKQSGWGMYWGDRDQATSCGPIFVVHTNNYAELVAVYNALKSGLERGFRRLTIYTDSNYVVNIFNRYIRQWKRNNWCRPDRSRPYNLRIIQEIDEIIPEYQQVCFRHVPGHSGIYENDMADNLAKEGAGKCQKMLGFSSFELYGQLESHIEKYFNHCQLYAIDQYGTMHLRGLLDALKGSNRRITDWRFFNRLKRFRGRTFTFTEFLIIAELAFRKMNGSCENRRFPMVEYDDEVKNGRDKISNCLAKLLVENYNEDWEQFDDALDEFMCLAGLWQRKDHLRD